MKPPYELSSEILRLVAAISHKLGAIDARFLYATSPTLRKQNQIKTIQSSLAIEGNSLSLEQITAIIDNKRVLGPQKDIREVLNAVTVYNQLHSLNYSSERDFLKAHRLMMHGLVERSGKYRTAAVGIAKGSVIQHIAPPHKNVPSLMNGLFAYLKDKKESPLIKSCVFHYEVEFIHPFMDGNGRMGRLWQTLILMRDYPVFGFLPFETLISENQREYYKVLSLCDKAGNSTGFIEYMLSILDSALAGLLSVSSGKPARGERMTLFLQKHSGNFSRKDYLSYFHDISLATASRDLRLAVEAGLISKQGDKKTTIYKRQK